MTPSDSRHPRNVQQPPIHIVVLIDEHLLEQLSPSVLLHLAEGRWVEDKETGLSMRLDRPNPALRQQRHIHIADRKHTSSKNMQVSWNQDGKRHDAGSFNTKLGDQKKVRDLARRVLELPSDVKLECLTGFKGLAAVLENNADPELGGKGTVYIKAFVKED